jgi:hypothetical protein
LRRKRQLKSGKIFYIGQIKKLINPGRESESSGVGHN